MGEEDLVEGIAVDTVEHIVVDLVNGIAVDPAVDVAWHWIQ